MTRLMSLVLMLASLTLGTAIAAQDANEVDMAVDPVTAVESGAEIEPVPEVSTDPLLEPNSQAAEAEIEAAFQQLVADSGDRAVWPNSAAEFMATQEDLSIFLMLLEEAELTESLAQDAGPVTIFAPSDAAFARMDQREFEALFDDAESLRDFLERHIAAGTYTTADFRADLNALTADGGPGEVAVTADVDVDPAGAGGGDGVIDIEPETAAIVEPEAAASVAGGGEAQGVAAASAPAYDPNAFVTVETREGTSVEVGTRPSSVRSDLSQLDTLDGVAAEVAGGGALDDIETTLYVDEAQIVERDLAIDGLTLHVIDRVLLPAESGDVTDR